MERYRRGLKPWEHLDHGRPYPDTDTVWTGRLSVKVDGYNRGLRCKWADGKTQTIESLIPSIVDGLELILETKKIDRENREESDRAWREFERRRELAKKRKERTSARLEFSQALAARYREIQECEAWLTTARGIASDMPSSAYSRMVECSEQRLQSLLASVDPDGIERQLNEKRLFPEDGEDELFDPLGEPASPRSNYW